MALAALTARARGLYDISLGHGAGYIETLVAWPSQAFVVVDITEMQRNTFVKKEKVLPVLLLLGKLLKCS